MATSSRRARLRELPEAREAALATTLLAVALCADLLGAAAVAWLLYAGCYLVGGWRSALEGVTALARGRLEVDLLMVVAALGAAALGQPRDGGLLIVIFAVSGAQEAAMHRRTEASVRDLLELAPEQAVLLTDDGDEQLVAAADLAVGDIVLVRPGERVTADGVVMAGRSEVDQASVTGEPSPVDKDAGDDVFAGTVNGSGVLRVRVTRPADEWVLTRIAGLVEQARAASAPTQQLIERVEQRYSVGMVVATLALVVGPLLLGDEPVREVLLRAMTFMVVASPCAIVLSTMPPLLAAVSVAGRHGVLVRSAAVMERLASIGAVALDKTGTLTEGRPDLVTTTAFPPYDEAELLALAAAAEAGSEHPVGRAVVEAARRRGAALSTAEQFTALPGRGVEASIGGRWVQVGSRRLLPDGSVALDGLEREGLTELAVLVDGQLAGVLGLADRLRPEAAPAVQRLAALTGRPVQLLTGDQPGSASRVAAEAGLDPSCVHAGLLPEDKGAAVGRLRADAGTAVLFVGDGVNDAPALAAADVGVAMGRGGSDLAIDSADVVLVKDDLESVAAVTELSRQAVRLVRQNLTLAAAAIAILVALNLTGDLPLPLGVAGHEGSTVLIGLNALRLLRPGSWPAGSPIPTERAREPVGVL